MHGGSEVDDATFFAVAPRVFFPLPLRERVASVADKSTQSAQA